jgi:hypothetical protein
MKTIQVVKDNAKIVFVFMTSQKSNYVLIAMNLWTIALAHIVKLAIIWLILMLFVGVVIIVKIAVHAIIVNRVQEQSWEMIFIVAIAIVVSVVVNVIIAIIVAIL